MKYPRPANLDTRYPEDCDSCGAAVTFGNVKVIGTIDSNGEIDFASGFALCTKCHAYFLDALSDEAKRRGERFAHIQLTPITVEDEDDDGTRH